MPSLSSYGAARSNSFPIASAAHMTPVLRALRRRRGLTQAALGELLGVTKARVSAIESDPGVVSIGQLLDILSRLGARVVIDIDAAPNATTHVAERAPATGEW
jgi:HTH-type transcriptional regulator / antitoxin HipB